MQTEKTQQEDVNSSDVAAPITTPIKPTTPIIKKKSKSASLRKRTREDEDEQELKTTLLEDGILAQEAKKQKTGESFTTKKATPSENTITHTFDAKRDQLRSDNAQDMATRTNDEDGVLPSVNKKTSTDPHRTGIGPIRGSQHIRISARFDYQPDICRDFFDTGYCGWGDNCKYAHIRYSEWSMHKDGAFWDTEKQWQEEQRKKKLGLDKLEEEEKKQQAELADGIPFACHMCRKSFDDPVETNCKHYFCFKCIMDRYNANDKTCPICSAKLSGVFNTAYKVIAKLERKKKQELLEQQQE